MSFMQKKKPNFPAHSNSDKAKEFRARLEGKIFVKYAQILQNQKYALELDSRNLHLPQSFIALIQWLRTKCSRGCVVKGIPECWFDMKSKESPLLEVELRNDGVSTSVLISRSNVYIVAYKFQGKWLSFKGIDYVIDGAGECQENARYEYPYCATLGAKALSNAIHGMQDENPFIRKHSCEVLFVHICEAVRFLPIQHQIYCGFKSFGVEYVAEETHLPLPMFPPTTMNFNDGVVTFDSIGGLINNWDHLSKAWTWYGATKGQHFDVNWQDLLFKESKIGCWKSLGESIGLLCAVDFVGLKKQANKLDRDLQNTIEEEIKVWGYERTTY